MKQAAPPTIITGTDGGSDRPGPAVAAPATDQPERRRRSASDRPGVPTSTPRSGCSAACGLSVATRRVGTQAAATRDQHADHVRPGQPERRRGRRAQGSARLQPPGQRHQAATGRDADQQRRRPTATAPSSSASTRTERSSCREVAPTQRSRANSRAALGEQDRVGVGDHQHRDEQGDRGEEQQDQPLDVHPLAEGDESGRSQRCPGPAPVPGVADSQVGEHGGRDPGAVVGHAVHVEAAARRARRRPRAGRAPRRPTRGRAVDQPDDGDVEGPVAQTDPDPVADRAPRWPGPPWPRPPPRRAWSGSAPPRGSASVAPGRRRRAPTGASVAISPASRLTGSRTQPSTAAWSPRCRARCDQRQRPARRRGR